MSAQKRVVIEVVCSPTLALLVSKLLADVARAASIGGATSIVLTTEDE